MRAIVDETGVDSPYDPLQSTSWLLQVLIIEMVLLDDFFEIVPEHMWFIIINMRIFSPSPPL